MSKKYKILFAVLLVIVTTIGLLLIDDELEPDAIKMVNEATQHQQSEAYVYLLGMQAAADEDPNVVGQQLLASIRAADKTYLDAGDLSKEYPFDGYPKNQKLTKFSLNSCKLEDKITDCDYVDTLRSHAFNLAKINLDQEVLLNRFNTLIAKDDFHSITTPHPLSPLPPYHLIMQGNDLNNLKILYELKNGSITAAERTLEKTIYLLRDHLVMADNLVHKMVVTAALSNNMDFLSYVQQQNTSPVESSMRVLSIAEKQLEKALNNEFAAKFNFSRIMGNEPPLSVASNEKSVDQIISKNWFNKGLNRIFYKPNMTINAALPLYKNAIQLSYIYASDLVKNEDQDIKKSRIRNYTGNILNDVSIPNFNQYIAKVFALDAKIKLYNKTLKHSKRPVRPDLIHNPFNPHEQNAYFSDDKKSICFEIPFIEKTQDKCLRLVF